jgi:hypothetical protein
VAVQDVKLPHKGANSPGFGTARMTGYEPLTSYIHQTDFKLSTDNQVEEFIGGNGMLKETNNYMVLLNYELPKALPVLWGQGDFISPVGSELSVYIARLVSIFRKRTFVNVR